MQKLNYLKLIEAFVFCFFGLLAEIIIMLELTNFTELGDPAVFVDLYILISECIWMSAKWERRVYGMHTSLPHSMFTYLSTFLLTHLPDLLLF